MDAGMVEYLIKPITFDNLANIVNKFIFNWINFNFFFIENWKKNYKKLLFKFI